MKIHLIFFLSEFVLGGAGNSIFKLCKRLSKSRFKITVISVNKCFYKKEFKKNGIQVIEIYSTRTFLAFFKLKKILKKISKNYKIPCVFISNINYSNVLSIIFLRNLKIKICLIERTPLEELNMFYNINDFIKKQIIKILIKFTYHKADACIANSKFISNNFNKTYGLNFKTIFPPSFKKINKFNENKNLNNRLKIITICRLSKEKGILDLIKTINIAKENITLDIIGSGPEYDKIYNLINQLKLNHKIKLIGYKNNKEIKKILYKYDLYINNSDFEGFPNTVVEAMSAQLPILARQSYGGINEIVTKNFGIIYKNNKELHKYLLLVYFKKIKFNFNRLKLYKHLKQFSETNNMINYKKIFIRLANK